MKRTAKRRFLRQGNAHPKRQTMWQIYRPTFDVLWIMSGPAYWQREVAIRQGVRAMRARGELPVKG